MKRAQRLGAYRLCIGVPGRSCIVEVPVDRERCHFCRRTLALRAEAA